MFFKQQWHLYKYSLKWLTLLTLVIVIMLVSSTGHSVYRQNLDNKNALDGIIGGAIDSYELQFASPYLLGLLALHTGQTELAVEHFQSISKRDNWFARRSLALTLEQSDQWREAILILQQPLPTDIKLRNEIAFRHWNEMDIAEREGHLEYLMKTNPSDIELFAALLLTIQHYADAESWAMTALNISPTASAYTTLGASRFYLGNLQGAEEAFARGYALTPDGMTAYWYGRVLAERGNAPAAVPILEKLVATTDPLDPVMPWYLRELAVSYAVAGQCAQAHSTFDKLHSDSRLELEGFDVTGTKARIQNLCP